MEVSKQNYGIAVSQPFHSVSSGDANLLFNSSWPSIAVPYKNTFSVTVPAGVTSYSITDRHGLNYYPLTMAWITDASGSYRVFPNVSLNTLQYTFLLDTASVDATQFTFHVKCFNVDISKDVEYPFISPPTGAIEPYDKNYGFKVVKKGKNIDSPDLRDFIVHSRCASPLILAVKTEATANGSVISYTPPDNYVAWAFGYGGIDKALNPSSYSWADGRVYLWAPPYQQTYPILNINSATNTYSINFLNFGSVIVLRDPLFVPTTVSAIYE